ncbi:hypothetical protein BDA96_03G348900 [Sorghum bicolor]|uniref:Uncharacterized protein n=2 Tax=Sorghum bicolor TaxID=4558 RepID=A0A921UQQ3_SORBI|nr:hypothetical protein BDA96_03G348900 [Sorghum bicolor]OQU87708.1 hypothetical protein SORBI_3003G323750 [Sorghum bicolor]
MLWTVDCGGTPHAHSFLGATLYGTFIVRLPRSGNAYPAARKSLVQGTVLQVLIKLPSRKTHSNKPALDMRNMASTAGYRNFLSNHPEENKPSTNTNVEATLQMSTNKHKIPPSFSRKHKRRRRWWLRSSWCSSRPPSIHRRQRQPHPTPHTQAAEAPWHTAEAASWHTSSTIASGGQPHQETAIPSNRDFTDGGASTQRRRSLLHPPIPPVAAHGRVCWWHLLHHSPDDRSPKAADRRSMAHLVVAPSLRASVWGSRHGALSPIIGDDQVHVPWIAKTLTF